MIPVEVTYFMSVAMKTPTTVLYRNMNTTTRWSATVRAMQHFHRTWYDRELGHLRFPEQEERIDHNTQYEGHKDRCLYATLERVCTLQRRGDRPKPSRKRRLPCIMTSVPLLCGQKASHASSARAAPPIVRVARAWYDGRLTSKRIDEITVSNDPT